MEAGKVADKLKEIFKLLSLNRQLESFVKDDFVSFEPIETLIQDLSQRDAVVSLNHIGFCYKTDSQTQERQTLTNSVPDSN
ncbi:MAG: hypothetical protein A2782_01010 [Candidatus Blackburnbacteria bacterium RIFCSPHIGHO2_01_FULL_43_15b]|uniref:Uncharacterized protein n=1 Tax=Candidatus Blackburnbacteria bacterium RIFCSPHIGHO2_01_FULL_43_15b TaxID=1797513 RepID=A0A1G1V154_9BACT|nr:MAG: hypothetical protein A2782_01010 [Candidatus Blackburnbacteria bacterium RIFCSPHIGHO2_01_FULL_43_15b]